MNSPLYDVVLALHVAAGLAGFGALGFTGRYAAALRRGPRGAEADRVRRYFRPGVNWASRALLLVPLLGGSLLAIGHGRDVGRPYPWIGLAIWVAATGVASAVVWPGERRIQQTLAAESASQAAGTRAATGAEAGGSAMAALCGRVERAAGVTSLLFVAAVVVMIVQPG
jgi:hypothetical protein